MPDFDTDAPSGGGVKAALTRKLGPLPVWAWGGIAIGGFVIARYLMGGGVGGGGTPIGSVIDADPGTGEDDFGGGGSDGGVQPPIVVPGTPGGNGTTRAKLTINKGVTKLPLWLPGATKLSTNIGPGAGEFFVQRVKVGAKYYFKIIGKAGPNNTLVASPRKDYLIPDTPANRKMFTLSRTPATQAA